MQGELFCTCTPRCSVSVRSQTLNVHACVIFKIKIASSISQSRSRSSLFLRHTHHPPSSLRTRVVIQGHFASTGLLAASDERASARISANKKKAYVLTRRNLAPSLAVAPLPRELLPRLFDTGGEFDRVVRSAGREKLARRGRLMAISRPTVRQTRPFCMTSLEKRCYRCNPASRQSVCDENSGRGKRQ